VTRQDAKNVWMLCLIVGIAVLIWVIEIGAKVSIAKWWWNR